jgi:hypothetical protein
MLPTILTENWDWLLIHIAFSVIKIYVIINIVVIYQQRRLRRRLIEKLKLEKLV